VSEQYIMQGTHNMKILQQKFRSEIHNLKP